MTTLDDLRRANLKEQRTHHEDSPVEKTGPQLELAAGGVQDRPASESNKSSINGTADAVSKGDDTLVLRVREVVSKRRVHGTGVKATVDMPPELFRRVKTYCKDHNNATLRQLFLDLMSEFLDAEGY